MTKKERPLSPHLDIYNAEFTSISSICHRASGVFNVLGIVGFVFYLCSLAFDFKICTSCGLANSLFEIILLLFVWSIFYHMCNGVRHLFFDIGLGFDIKNSRITAFLVVIFSIIFTATTWLFLYNVI